MGSWGRKNIFWLTLQFFTFVTIEKFLGENLWKQNEKLLNAISEKDNEIRNLTSIVLKLQNDIQGYIKQIGEGSREPGNNIADIIIKTSLAIALLVLVWYLVFS